MPVSYLRAVLCSLMIAGLSACALYHSNNFPRSGPNAAGQYAPTNPAQIIVRTGDIKDHPYVTLGDVSAHVDDIPVVNGDQKTPNVNALLLKNAAAMGADAVIFTRYGAAGSSFFNDASRDGKGQAIRFTDK